MERDNILVLAFGAVFLFSMIMIIGGGARVTGFATEGTTFSNVSIQKYFAVAMSENLSDGIQFGSISDLPVTDQNATHNYDGANTTDDDWGENFGSSMWMNVSTDSNTEVNFCINASADLQSSGGDSILIGNETYYNSTLTNSSNPNVTNQVALTTGYVMAGANISVGGTNYYRFWLDVPVAQPSGTYNNTVGFKGVESTGSC